MKKVLTGFKKFRDLIKKLKKTEKGKSILFFSFWGIFFLVIAILARVLPRGHVYNTSDYIKKNTFSFASIEKNNYSFSYTVNIDGLVYNYIGIRKDDDELFLFNNLDYYKKNDSYFSKINEVWVRAENPYLFSDFFNIKNIYDMYTLSTYISKTEYENKDFGYNYKLATETIVKMLENIDIDIEEVPNDLIFTTDSNGTVKKIELILNSYGKYKGLCVNTFVIALNYSDFSSIKEVVSPID
jgi:hypothetical protein